ncbi:MAG TPA: HDOD domain-containing protein [Planctomycetes bacterium]|nr:HDOD domain-containing protein [Planctomycetota bacterium]HIL37700.1 HDOD domain-containing protein [Planctomycetota bacterium]
MVDLLRSIVTNIRSLAPFPQVATTVLGIAARPDVTSQQLIKVIQTDPGLTGKVLKLCNSAYYGFQREIASLEEAGTMLGARTLTSLVLPSCASNYFQEARPANDRQNASAWQDAVTTAIASRLVASTTGRVDPERAYTAGLLLNVGELILDRHCEKGLYRVEQQVQLGSPRILAENVVLGISHAEIGARLATRWMLPQVLIDTIRCHHAPEKATQDPSLTAAVHLAEALALHTKASESCQGDKINSPFPVSEFAWQRADMLPQDLLKLRSRLNTELAQVEDQLAA